MKPYQVITSIIVVVVLNNLLLLSLLGYFSDQAVEVASSQTPTASAVARKVAEPVTSDKAVEYAAKPLANRSEQVTEQKSDDQVFDAVRRFSQSDEFLTMLDNYQLNAGPRFEKLQKQFATMDGPDIFFAALEGESEYEKQLATITILQGRLHELDTTQLKTLYQSSTSTDWGKPEILIELMHKDDPDGLLMAKQLISDENFNSYIGQDIYTAIHERDPDFISEYLKSVTIDGSTKSLGIVSFAVFEPDLADAFVTENFEKIINSENSQIYQVAAAATDVKLSDRQQEMVSELFSSSNRHKRGYAINMVASIDNIELLRDGYASLKSARDQQSFIRSLKRAKRGSEKRNLANELAQNSDNPKIQELAL